MTLYVRPEIAAMSGYVSGEQPKTFDIIKINTNENPYKASERVFEAVKNAAFAGLSRYPDATARPFREAAAELYGLPSPDWIICGNGSDDILTILTRTFVGTGDLLRLPYPSYVLYKSLAELQGAEYEEIPFNSDWTLPECFANKTPNLRLAFLPNPNSPSGTLVAKDEILKIAERLPCPLVVDEAYADFTDSNCIDLVKKCGKIICVRTLSKSYSLAGLRFGFAIARPAIIANMNKVRDSYNCDLLSIAAACAAIADQDWLKENKAKILLARLRLTEGMRNLGFDVVDSHANFTWNTHKHMSVKPIYEYLKQNNVLVRYMNYPQWGDGLRISVGTDEQIERCLALIAKLI